MSAILNKPRFTMRNLSPFLLKICSSGKEPFKGCIIDIVILKTCDS